MGAFGFWLITKIEERWRKPSIRIEYGVDYPFRASALFENGQKAEFIRVRVKNEGRGTAKRCKCYIRHITLNAGGRLTRLPSEELMLTSWVPREAGVTVINIPSNLDFLADVAYTIKVGTSFKLRRSLMFKTRTSLTSLGTLATLNLRLSRSAKTFPLQGEPSSFGSMANRRFCCHCCNARYCRCCGSGLGQRNRPWPR
jgi:hypothetical protein